MRVTQRAAPESDTVAFFPASGRPHIQQRSNNLLQVEEGSLYPALQRLLKPKLVRAEWTISHSTNRRVRIYEITKAGIHHLEHELSSFDRMLEGIQMVLGPVRRAANS